MKRPQVVIKYAVIRGVKRLAAVTLQARQAVKENELPRSPTGSAWDRNLEEGSPALRAQRTDELDPHLQRLGWPRRASSKSILMHFTSRKTYIFYVTYIV